MPAMHQRSLVDADSPIKAYIASTEQFPPHWHEVVEIIYALEDGLRVGLHQDIHELRARDIVLVGSGDVHSFPPMGRSMPRLIVQFDPVFLESFSTLLKDRRFAVSLLRSDADGAEQAGDPEAAACALTPGIPSSADAHAVSAAAPAHAAVLHAAIEGQLLALLRESTERREGYRLAQKARVYDLLLLLLRSVPMEQVAPGERTRRLGRLERLEKVLAHVEQHFGRAMPLEEVAALANYSVFHFTRFFRETTGMTFNEYVNQYRVEKSVALLLNTSDPITEIVYGAGFSSAKTFNRVFHQIMGCSPSAYRKSVRTG